MQKHMGQKKYLVAMILAVLISLAACAGSDSNAQADSGSASTASSKIVLPQTLPEKADTMDIPGPASVVTGKARMNFDFVVRYTQSDFERTAQLSVPDHDEDGWKWESNNPSVALVSSTGLVTCNMMPGEAKITATNGDGIQATCWVYVLEPEMFGGEDYYRACFFPEGDISLWNYDGDDINDRIQQTKNKTATDLLPYLTVNDIGSEEAKGFTMPSVSGAALEQLAKSGTVDQDGNPIMIYAPTEEADQQENAGDISLRFVWQSVYFGGRYRIPEHLRNGDSTYTVTNIMFDYGAYVQELSIPATVRSFGNIYFYGDEGEAGNPFAMFTELKAIHVDEGNPSYKTDDDGVLYSADGAELISMPAAAEMRSYEIPSSVSTVGAGAFEGNRNLEKINIPASVSHIGENAFAGMQGLERIDLADGNPAFTKENGVIKGNNGKTLVACSPAEMPQEYTVGEEVTEINRQAFTNNDAIHSLTVDASAQELYIEGCTALQTLIINGSPDVVTVSDCAALKTVQINGNVSNCNLMASNLEELAIGGTVSALSISSDKLKTFTGTENVLGTLTLESEKLPALKLADALQELTIKLHGGTADLSTAQGGNGLETLSILSSGGELQVKGFSAIAGQETLKTLNLFRVKLDDWHPVWRFVNLKTLDLDECAALESLEGIEALTALTRVSLAGTDISDLSPLAECKSLESLDISSCKSVEDISPLADLPELYSILLYDSGVPQSQIDSFGRSDVSIY